MAYKGNNLPVENFSSTNGLKLDLYNFESAYAEDSPYVLTSPRSLEACAQLDLKPVELLVKPLSDFEEECLLNGHPISYARHMYEAYETNRLEKLKFCRQIRERIILEEDETESEEELGLDVRHGKKAWQPDSTVSLSNSLKHSPRQAKTIPVVELGQGDYNKDNNTHHSQTKTLSQASQSARKPLRKRKPTSGKKTLRQNRSHSTSSLCSSSVMSLASSSRSVGNGRYSRMANYSLDMLSDRDKRILDLMETRHIVKQAEEKIKHISRLAWEEDKLQDETAKVETEKRRRQNVSEANERRQRKQEHKNRQKLNKELSTLEANQQQVLYHEEKHRRLIETQNKLKALEIQQRQKQRSDKKKKQELVLEEREKAEEVFRQVVDENLALKLELATEIKTRKEKIEMLERQRRNAEERSRHKSLRESVNKESKDYTEQMHHSLRLKHDRAERSLQTQTRHREQQLQHQREKELVKQLRNQQTKQEHEHEMADWKQHLMVKGRMSQQRAVDQASQISLLKANKASHVRRSKERIHRELLYRVKEDEKAEKEFIKEKIAYKDYKTKVHSHEKDQTMQRSREIARVSAQFRDTIRAQYSGSFDKLVQKAELESRVGIGPRSAAKNSTTPGVFY